MEEKQINERESIEIITAMISRTREKYMLGDGDIMLLWGYVTLGVSVLVWALLAITHNPSVNWLWFLIWAIGGLATPFMVKKRIVRNRVMTYTDKVVSRLWLAVGAIGFGCAAVCISLFFAGADAWAAMFIYALVVVPFAEITQGIALSEHSLVWGGAVGMAIGIFVTGCILGETLTEWIMPLFIAAFVCMMIIPGHLINCKAKRDERA